MGPTEAPERYKLGKLKHDRRRRGAGGEPGGVQYQLDMQATACQTWDSVGNEWKASASPVSIIVYRVDTCAVKCIADLLLK